MATSVECCRMRRSLLACLCVALVLVSVACKKKLPKAGDPCKEEGAHVCLDETTRVTCDTGTWVFERCTSCIQSSKSGFGSKSSMETFVGCALGGDGPEGTACKEGLVDCANPKLEVKCEGGKYKHYPCKGRNGCLRTGTSITCDFDIADVGDACRENNVACSPDARSYLRCVNGKFAAEVGCAGPKGCYDAKDTLHCDAPFATVGQPCVGKDGACSADHKDLVVCDNGTFVVRRRCRGKNAVCAADDLDSNCVDPSILQAGDPCSGDVGGCSPDGRAMLKCKDNVVVVEHACKTCKSDDPAPGRYTCHF